MNAYLSGNVLIVNGFLTDPTTFNSAAPSTEFVNLGTMIPEIKDYIVVAEPIAGMNLVLRSKILHLLKVHQLHFILIIILRL